MRQFLTTRLGVASASGLTPQRHGGATRSLLKSISRVVLVTAAGWQLVMLWATLVDLGATAWPLALAQVAAGAAALAALRIPALAAVIAPAMVASGIWSYLASGDIDSVLTFAACWQINFSSCVAGLLMLRRSTIVLVVVSALCTAAVLLAILPEWGLQLPLSIVVTQSSIIIAIRLGLSTLIAQAVAADDSAREAEAEELRTQSLQYRSARLAEESRVLHDTAINTLGAIANAGVGASDIEQVRRQCARDVALLAELRGAGPEREAARLRDVFTQPGLPAVRGGLDDEELDRLEAALPQRTIAGIVGCVREAVTNATKHSGADRVGIDLSRTGESATIRVSDSGVGFAGPLPRGRGVDASILRRAESHGFAADVESEPGTGTVVTLTVRIDDETHARAPIVRDLMPPIESVHRRSGELWGTGVAVVGVVLIIAGGTNEGFALIPMVGVMLLAVLLFRLQGLRRSRILLPSMLMVCTLVTFFLSGRATSFGLVGAAHWQALAATGPFVLLLSLRPGRSWTAAGAVVWAGLVATMAVAVVPESVPAAEIVLVAGCVGLGFSGVWAMFQTFVVRLSEREAGSRQRLFAARLQSELEAASQSSYRRWTDAGLDSAVAILQDIGSGARTPSDEDIRRSCDREERYLRQLVQVSPTLVHLSPELVPMLRHARERDVDFKLRLGDVDAWDDDVAREIGATILASLDAAPPGGSLSASLFPVREGLHLTLTGEGLRPPEQRGGSVRHDRFGSLELLEVSFTRYAALTGRSGRDETAAGKPEGELIGGAR